MAQDISVNTATVAGEIAKQSASTLTTSVQSKPAIREYSEPTVTSKVEMDLDLSKLKDVSMEIRIDDSTQMPIVTLKSKASGEVMMQIPAEYSLTIQQSLEIALGAIVDTKS